MANSPEDDDARHAAVFRRRPGVLGGFYVIETEHDDALLALLPQAPLPHGTGYIELRPVV